LYKTEDNSKAVRNANYALNNTRDGPRPETPTARIELNGTRKERAHSFQGPRSQPDMDLMAYMQRRPSMNDFELGSKLGEGAYAVVRSCRHKKTQDKIAMKIYDKYKLNDPIKKRSVSREIELLKKFQHPNIVKFYDSIDTNRTINLVMEHAQGTSLYSYLKK
jgi:serine/threonine protein kinase